MAIFALLAEPANYTLDLIQHIYLSRGIAYAFMKHSSKASDKVLAEDALNALPIRRRIKKLLKILNHYDAFIVNGYTGLTPCLLIWLNILFFRKPMSIESDTELQIPKSRLKRFLKWCWLRFLFTRTYCYGFAGGNYNHKELFRHYGMKEERIYLAPMMVNNNQYFAPVLTSKKTSTFCFGYIGRLVKIKQVDGFIKAIQHLFDEGLHVKGLIIGNGEEVEILKQMAVGYPITFTGNLFAQEKIQALHSLDVLVLYSRYEPWGLVVNEALASGRPVVISDRVGARNDLVMGDMPTGLVAKWDDWKDLAEKMKQIMLDKALYRQLSENARVRISKWDYSLYGEQLDSWIRNVSK